MKIGIIGLPTVGKTTLFNLLTGSQIETSGFSTGKADTNIGVAKVPDDRIDFLSKLYKPRKTIYASIEFIDVPGLRSVEGKSSSNQFLESIRKVDAIVHVVRAFNNPSIIHENGSIDPIRDIETVNTELLLSDLGIIENRIDRIKHSKKKSAENETEQKVLEKCAAALEEGQLIHSLGFNESEKELLKNFAFLTEKPQIIVLNLDDEQLITAEYPGKSDTENYSNVNRVPVVELCAQMEMEISQLAEEDSKAFLEDLGLAEPGIARLSRTVYSQLGLISFFTVGEDEVKAWTINEGINAKQAAGKIHSDIERGFIRAEVFAFDDLKELGSVAKLRENGRFRLEGKDYIVKDGDIISFRFNV
jgi:GTP-binding protein YchF